MRTGPLRRQRGFTLIEVIVVVVIAGLLGALLVNLMGTTLLKSSSASTVAQQSAQAESMVERIVATFVHEVNTDPPADGIAKVKADYGSNASITLTDMTIDGAVPALRVTVTVGQSSATTLLTQERTTTNDTKASY